MTGDTGRSGDDDSAKSAASDSEAALQAELQREAAEGGGTVDDMASDRNMSGSSTWVTLPDSPADGTSPEAAP
jgi:hypothetical protein